MRAWMSRKQRKRPLRTQTTAASDVSQRSQEDSVSCRDRDAENAAAASAVDQPVARTSVRDEASTSRGFRPFSHGSSDSLGSSQTPSTRNERLAAEAASSQPNSSSVSAEHESCIVWPRPLLESAEASSETSDPGSVGFFPFFGARNILNFSKKGGKGKLLSRRNVEGCSQSETEAIESGVLKWETYESPQEEPAAAKI
ncbi:hypothetical protein MTO96_041388 [Rhipicephalus appendiculatus]